MKKAVRKHSLVTIILLVVFLLMCQVELKAIYWGGLDKPTAFSLSNASAALSFLILTSLGTFLFLLYLLPAPSLFKFKERLQSHPAVGWLLFFVCSLLPAWILLFSYWGSVFISPFLRIWLLASVFVIMTFLISQEKGSLLDLRSFLVALVVAAGIFLAADRLKEVVDYPFTLYWSEGNRFWDYSLLFGRQRYAYPGSKPIFAFIDLGRQSLWGLPFLLGDPSIVVMRLWNALLFILPCMLLGAAIFFKKKISIPFLLLCALWTFIFLNQGPIYTPLVLVALLVVLADRSPLGVGVVLLLAAGYYANLTRYSWSLAPAIWAGLLGLFQSARDGKNPFKVNWGKTILLTGAGLLGGVALPMLMPLSNFAVQDNQGSILSTAQSTLQNQALIWSRLFPNPTYPTGILGGLLLAILPIFLLMGWFIKRWGWKLNVWQTLGVSGSSLVFLSVGLIASIKIGGGSNLHNMDMFFLNTLLLAGIAWRSGAQGDLLTYTPEKWWGNLLLVLLAILPAVSVYLGAKPLELPSRQDQQNALNAIKRNVDQAKVRGEVLFIDQRQLLTFNNGIQVALVPEYEKKYLMDQAMSGNKELFQAFYRDLRNQRFSLIINEPIFIDYQSEEVNFGTENDIWVTWVSEPLLCYYEPVASYDNVGVEMLIPRTKPANSSKECP